MRTCLVVVLLALLVVMAPRPAVAQTPGQVLSGYRYVEVVLPVYEGNKTDQFGFGQHLLQRFREDKTWTVLNDLPQAQQQDAAIANEIVQCVLEHTGSGRLTNRATLRFYDVVGTLLTSIEGKSTNAWTWEGSIKGRIDFALRDIRKDRRFDPNRVVDLASRFKDVEKVEMTEDTLRRYIDDNGERLRSLEGIWSTTDGMYRVGIMRRGSADRLVAFVLETNHALWRPQMVKASFELTAYSDLFTTTYFLGNHTRVGATAKLAGGLLSIPVTRDGKEDVITFVKNYPTNISPSIGGTSPDGRPVERSSGTGFVVGRNLIVTCNHVIKDAKRIEIAFSNGKESFPLETVVQDAANDLAVLRVLPNEKGSYPTLTPIALAGTAEVRLGELVYTIGYPLGDLLGEAAKLTDGTVSALSGIQGDPRMLQISAPIQPGNSGGPLFDSKGSAVGVVVATLNAKYLYENAGVIPQSVNFAVRADYVLTLLRSATKNLTVAPALTNMSRLDQIERLQGSVGQIRAYTR